MTEYNIVTELPGSNSSYTNMIKQILSSKQYFQEASNLAIVGRYKRTIHRNIGSRKKSSSLSMQFGMNSL